MPFAFKHDGTVILARDFVRGLTGKPVAPFYRVTLHAVPNVPILVEADSTDEAQGIALACLESERGPVTNRGATIQKVE